MASVIQTADDSGVVAVCTSGQPRESDSDLIVEEGRSSLLFKFICLTNTSPKILGPTKIQVRLFTPLLVIKISEEGKGIVSMK